MRGARYLATMVLGAAACVAFAQDRQLEIAPVKTAPAGERRIALVIGNSAYKTAPLKNPVNDARAISKALAATGFKVHVLEDASQAAMRRAIRNFGDDIQAGGVGLFYYAGHGMQVRGKNFLVPVNADIEREDEIEDQAVDANLVLSKMDSAKNTINLMILDACRNNPFARAFRSAAQGLAQMDAPSGTLIAFATAPGSVASDGEGDNGLYTKHLLANIGRQGMPIEQMFKEVRRGVARDTRDRQIPWESSSLKGDFFFVPGAPVAGAQRDIEQAVAVAVQREQEKLAALQKQMELMVQQMLAKQRAELEAELKGQRPAQAGPVAAASAPAASPPAPVPVVPTPSPLQVASAAPSAMLGVGIADDRYPKVGDRWEYLYTDTTTRRTRRATYAVTAVSKDGIVESGGFGETAATTFVHSSGPQLVLAHEVHELSPFLLAFGAPKGGERWTALAPLRNWGSCARQFSCRFEARVGGMEKVTVPAGTFDARKVVVELVAVAAGTRPIVRETTFWYSEAAKRVVKATARAAPGSTSTATFGGYDLVTDYDFVLSSYKLN